MNFKTNKKLLVEAMNSGCTTVGQLAIFLKAKSYGLRGKNFRVERK